MYPVGSVPPARAALRGCRRGVPQACPGWVVRLLVPRDRVAECPVAECPLAE